MKKGFTLIEITIVVSLVAVMLLLTMPTVLRFFSTQNVQDTTRTLLSTLRQAHDQAVFQKNDSAFGVKFLSGSYVLFQGVSYAARVTSEDITVTIPAGITISGISETVFAKRTGIPSVTGTVLIQSSTGNTSLSVNAQGTIEL